MFPKFSSRYTQAFIVFFQALLQKGDVLDQLGNHEMALVYYHRGQKRYPKSEEFKKAISRAEKKSVKKGKIALHFQTLVIKIFR